MNKQRSKIVYGILIILIAALLFLFLQKGKQSVTEEDIKVVIKEEYGFDVEILKSAETVNFKWDGNMKTAIFKKKEDVDYVGRIATVRTKDKKQIEFEIEVIKYPKKPLRIVGTNLGEVEYRK